MPIDVLVFGTLAIRADLIEAIQQSDSGTRIVLTTGREYDVAESFDLVVQVMKSMRKPGAAKKPADWGRRHTA